MAKSDKRGLAPFATSREGQILYPILRSAKSADEYVDSAIAHNIQHSLRLYQYGGHFRALQELYEAGELTSVINRVVEDVALLWVTKGSRGEISPPFSISLIGLYFRSRTRNRWNTRER